MTRETSEKNCQTAMQQRIRERLENKAAVKSKSLIGKERGNLF